MSGIRAKNYILSACLCFLMGGFAIVLHPARPITAPDMGLTLVSWIETGKAGVLRTNEATFDLMNYIGFGRVLSLSIVIGVIDVILLTAISTLGAFLYNVCSSLVGGLQLTLTDD